MDEYFCPNCGAILNNQPGFNPDGGTWTCTSCGQLLMDDDVYEGDTLEGVAWYCDDCGALLNRQTGFSDAFGSWRCTNCGYINGTTEDDIIDDGPVCPCCGDHLKHQSLYSEFDDDWTCEACGAKLHRDYSFDDYEEVDIDEDDDDDDEEVDVDTDEDDDDESLQYCQSQERKTDAPHSNSRGNCHTAYSSSATEAEEKLPDSELRKKRVKAFIFKRKRIEVGYDYTELLRKNFKIVVTVLHNEGFNNIKTIPVKDIYKKHFVISSPNLM